MRSRCQYGIGDGILTKKEKLPSIDSTLTIVEEGGHTGDTFWNVFDSTKKESTVGDEEEEEERNTVSKFRKHDTFI